jgi:hypothetical protein
MGYLRSGKWIRDEMFVSGRGECVSVKLQTLVSEPALAVHCVGSPAVELETLEQNLCPRCFDVAVEELELSKYCVGARNRLEPFGLYKIVCVIQNTETERKETSVHEM